MQWSDTSTFDQQWRLIPAGVTNYDFVAPAAPTQVAATANAVSIQLNWRTNSETDLASYTVLRSTTNSGPYYIVARGLTNNTFTDKSANVPQNFYYVVQAVDRSLNTSVNSTPVSATPPCAPALVAHYAFNGNTSDSSGNANDANAYASPVAYVTGTNGQAMVFDNIYQYALAPAGMMASVTNFTIATWVYLNTPVGTWQRIFDFGNGTTQYMFLTPNSGSGTLRFAVTTNGGGAEQNVEKAMTFPTRKWVHVAVTYNGTTATLYSNAVSVASGPVAIPPASFNPMLNYLGKSQYPGDPLLYGRLDEFFVYNYALSATEIARLMNNLPPPPVAPTTLTVVVATNTLSLSWPSNYLGCRLLMQTNNLAKGLSANTSDWGTVADSQQTNEVFLPINPTLPTEFYRLVYP